MLGAPTRDRKAERRAETRREIIDAAWEIARESGLNQLTLRDLAARVGMQAPSLYTHFESKIAIYDAMFAEAWSGYADTIPDIEASLPDDRRAALQMLARAFYDYATADLARHQLMSQRIIPGFEPTPEAYAPSVKVLERSRERVLQLADVSSEDFEIWVALLAGLVNQHHANDPGGGHHAGLLRRAVDMWADAAGLPATPHTARRRPSRKERPS
jgi:AcrR family transcriptional regulator